MEEDFFEWLSSSTQLHVKHTQQLEDHEERIMKLETIYKARINSLEYQIQYLKRRLGIPTDED